MEKNFNEKFSIQITNPEGSTFVAKATQLEREMMQKRTALEAAQSKAAGKPLVDPMMLYDTPEDARLVRWRDELAAEYQAKYMLPDPPTLLPANLPLAESSQQQCGEKHAIPDAERFHYYQHHHSSPLLPEQLKDQLLQRLPMFRDRERLYCWEGNSHFRFLPDSEVKARIKTVLRDEFYIPNPAILLNTLLSLLKAEERIAGIPDNHPHLIAVQNGEIDLRTMTLNPASPSHHLTHYLDVPWFGDQPCPVFTAFLRYTSGGNAELAQRILEAIGFLLVSDNAAKKFVVFQGSSDCGKSVLGNLIASYFERGDCASLADYRFGDKFSMAALANCHLCLCMDLADGVIDGKAVSTLKQITGGDLISIEAKGKDAFTDYVRCKLLFGTNNPIRLKSRDTAFANRLLLIPFFHPVPPEHQDRTLLEKLKAERSAILYQALHAYRAVVDRGYRFSGEAQFGFTPSHIVVETPTASTMEDFVAQICSLDENAFTPTEDLHTAYTLFCNKIGRPTIADRSSFSRALNTYLCGCLRSGKQRVNGIPMNGYWGICLKAGGVNNV